MRQVDMEWEIRDYLAKHPAAAVVNMGCGLDQTGRACDNGTCHIYNIDMPDIIAAREEGPCCGTKGVSPSATSVKRTAP